MWATLPSATVHNGTEWAPAHRNATHTLQVDGFPAHWLVVEVRNANGRPWLELVTKDQSLRPHRLRLRFLYQQRNESKNDSISTGEHDLDV